MKTIYSVFLFISCYFVNIYSQQPVLSYPENGSIIGTLTPTLQWGGLGINHARVRVQVDTSYNFLMYSIVDVELPQGTTSYTIGAGKLRNNVLYHWRVGAYYYPGYYSYSNISNFTTPITGILEINTVIPETYSLSQNYPNPFNPSTKIKFQISAGSSVAQTFLSVFDVLSKEVAILVNQNLQSGTYEVDWKASELPSGIYFYTLKSGDYTETRKMVLSK